MTTEVLLAEPHVSATLAVGDGIATVVIDRADKLNSITWLMRWEIMRCIEAAEADDRAKVIVLRGAGDRAFSAGGDIPEFLDLPDESLTNLAYPMGAPERCTKPVIAAIDGHCYGGGLELTLACDFRIATAKSRFAFPEVTLGAMPGSGGTQRAVRLMGVGRAKAMVMTGTPITAEKAERWGLITEMVADGTLDDEVHTLAARLAGFSPLSMRLAKRTLDNAPDASLESGLLMEGASMTVLVRRPHFSEGVAAWREKRPPVFE